MSHTSKNKDIDPHEFVGSISCAVQNGFGFVPFIGSGISAPSAIPTGSQIADYLTYCISQMLLGKPADFSDGCWPHIERAIENPPRRTELIESQYEIYKTQRDDDRPKDILEPLEILGALASWRSALQFVARSENMAAKPDNGTETLAARCPAKVVASASPFSLGAPSPAIIDSAFLHLIKNSQPCLGHMMLARIADNLRIQTILTTNFDELIETAFVRLGAPLVTFDVHHKTELPPRAQVCQQRSLIKLHGGRYGLRADCSLDETPNSQDRDTFKQYFQAPYGGHATGTLAHRNHLLVLGVSGDDRRTINLIRHAQETIPGLEVFWVCYRSKQVNTVRSNLNKRNRLHITVHEDIGLLLLEMYQRINLALPPAGTNFPFLFHLPPRLYRETNFPLKHPLEFTNKQKHNGQHSLNRVVFNAHKKQLTTALKNRGSSDVLVVTGPKGVTSVASGVVDSSRDEYQCVWLEWAEFFCKDDFLVGLVEAISQRVGQWGSQPPLPEVDEATCAEFIVHLLGKTRDSFLILIDCRDDSGVDAGWPGKKWESDIIANFWKSIVHLKECLVELKFGHRILFAVLARNDDPPVFQTSNPENHVHLAGDSITISTESIVSGVIGKIAVIPNMEMREELFRLAYGLTLFRHSRFPAALCSLRPIDTSNANADDQDERTLGELVVPMLEILTKNFAFRYQPGGFVWMHADIRNGLREGIEGECESNKICLSDFRPRCHQAIADWYVKLFRSSNDPRAALEAIYHRLQCIAVAGSAHTALVLTSLNEMMQTLSLARKQIQACGYFKPARNMISELPEALDTVMEQFRASSVRCPLQDEAIEKSIGEIKVLSGKILRDYSMAAADFCYALKIIDEQTMVATEGTSEIGEPILLEKSKRHYYRTKCYMGLRLYEMAEREMTAFLQELKLPSHDEWAGFQADTREMWQAAERWAGTHRADQKLVEIAVRGLSQYQFLRMLEAQLLGTNGDNNGAREHLDVAVAVYPYVTVLMRYVKDQEFLQWRNCHLRTNCGVLMGTLGRTHEAHRRLSEASGYLSQSNMRGESIPWACIELRRAELHLLNFEKMAAPPTPASPECEAVHANLVRRRFSVLEDAENALDRALPRLVEQRKVLWWMTWYSVLRMRVVNGRASLREKWGGEGAATCWCPLLQTEFEYCAEAYVEGMRFVRTDVFRMAQLTQEFLRIIGTYWHCAPARERTSDILDRGIRHFEKCLAAYMSLKEGETQLNDCIVTFAEKVLNDARNRRVDIDSKRAATSLD